jgi:hemerythrin-like domain-containing protein
MNLHTQLEYFHGEHDEIHVALNAWEAALQRVGSADDAERRKGLMQLRELKEQIRRIQEHCHREEQQFESSFQMYLDGSALGRLRGEHDELARLTSSFLTELDFASVLRTGEVVARGGELIELLRKHINYEDQLLTQIEERISAKENYLSKCTQ